MSKILSAGVEVVRGQNAARRLPLLRAYQNWDFPKGVMGPEEDRLQGAIREVAGETMLTELNFRRGYDFCEAASYGRGKAVHYYLARNRADRGGLAYQPGVGQART